MDKQTITELEEKACKARKNILKVKFSAKSGHIGTAFSCVDILTYLYNTDLVNFSKQPRDFFIMSKAHGSTALYAVLMDKGIIAEKEFFSLNVNGSYFGDHVCSKIPGVEFSLGSLGHGLSVSAGVAHAAKLDKEEVTAVALLGDGECNEGMVWEAASVSGVMKLDNLIAFIDHNKWQGYGRSEDFTEIGLLEQRWESFGWEVHRVNGHDFTEIHTAFKNCVENKNSKPKVIIADTVKGKGVSFMEDTLTWHYKSMNQEQYDSAMEELR